MQDVETSIPARFEKIVRMYPDRFAVAMDDERMTYEALNRAANRLAYVILADRDIGNNPVVIILPPGIFASYGDLGGSKAGKMFATGSQQHRRRSKSHPRGRSSKVAYNGGKRQVWFTGLGAAKSPNDEGDIDASQDGRSDQNPRVRVTPDMGAYIKYTSGTTRRAKGVIIPHRTILHGVMSYTNSCHFCSHDRSVQVNGN